MKLWQKETTSISEKIEKFTVGRDREIGANGLPEIGQQRSLEGHDDAIAPRPAGGFFAFGMLRMVSQARTDPGGGRPRPAPPPSDRDARARPARDAHRQ